MSSKSIRFRGVVSCVLFTAFLLQSILPAGAFPQTPGSEDLLKRADSMIRSGELDAALTLLEAAIREIQDPERLRASYLLYVKGLVLKHNDLMFVKNENWAATQARQDARDAILACLNTPGLQHTRPTSEIETPKLMTELFDEVRSQNFGSLKIESLDPPEALVVFRGDTLSAEPGDPIVEEDIAVGSYVIVIQAGGYRPYTANVDITPGSSVILNPALDKNRGPWPWVLLATGAGALIALVAILLPDDKNVAQPLPGPPDPPTKPAR